MLASLLWLLLPAAAADLTVALDWTGAPAPLALVLQDVAFGDLPAFVVPNGEGQSRRLDVSLSPAGEGQVRYVVEIYDIEERKNGTERRTLLSAPQIVAEIGQEATVSQGARAPLPDGTFEASEMTLRLVYGPPAAP